MDEKNRPTRREILKLLGAGAIAVGTIGFGVYAEDKNKDIASLSVEQQRQIRELIATLPNHQISLRDDLGILNRDLNDNEARVSPIYKGERWKVKMQLSNEIAGELEYVNAYGYVIEANNEISHALRCDVVKEEGNCTVSLELIDTPFGEDDKVIRSVVSPRPFTILIAEASPKSQNEPIQFLNPQRFDIA